MKTKRMAKTTLFFVTGLFAVLFIVLIPCLAAFVMLMWTAEILRYIFSLGRYKPRWGISTFMKAGWHSESIFQVSMYLGIAFWLLALVLVRNLGGGC
jgi:hypothetical protein